MNKSQLAKFERAVEGLKNSSTPVLKDLSNLSDEELLALHDELLVNDTTDYSHLEGLSDQELSDLYMQTILAGNKSKKKKKR
jgi:hypothetical protein